MCLRFFPLLALVVGFCGCLDTPTPGAPILTRCWIEGADVQGEIQAPCWALAEQFREARTKAQDMGWSVGTQGLTVIYRDADFFKCDDALCAMKDLGYWHGEDLDHPTIELTRNGKLLLHELFHQADPSSMKHEGWDKDGRAEADGEFRSSGALRL